MTGPLGRLSTTPESMYALSAVTGDAFPQLLTSLSMAKERYYQSPRVFIARC